MINHRRELRGRLQLPAANAGDGSRGGPHQESHNGTVEVGPDLECWFNAAGSEELLEKEDILELIK